VRAAPPEALRQVVQAQAFPAEPSAAAGLAARAVAQAGGPAVRAVVFFGSRKSQARPDRWSAYDFFVLVRSHGEFYRALRAARRLGRPPGLMAALNRVLPPNQLSLEAEGAAGERLVAKCAVVSLEAFARETSWRRRDHFFLGRLFQPVEVAYAADAAAGEAVVDGLTRAAHLTLDWSRPWLPERFDVDAFTRALLHVSFRAEIRPEPEGRADALWEAQREALRRVYGVLLAERARGGDLREPEPGVFALARPAGAGARLRLALYFRWSLVRATARWLKHMVTFEGWLEFIVRKAQRHSGQEIELTPRERRWPLVFLWPRVLRYLRHKDRRV
jgi:hypothetical protein